MTQDEWDNFHDVGIEDADGARLRQYDDVVLLRSLAPTSIGNCPSLPDEIPVGTRATAVMLVDGPTGLVDLECYVSRGQFAFAEDTGANLRVVLRREEKLAPNFSRETH